MAPNSKLFLKISYSSIVLTQTQVRHPVNQAKIKHVAGQVPNTRVRDAQQRMDLQLAKYAIAKPGRCFWPCEVMVPGGGCFGSSKMMT